MPRAPVQCEVCNEESARYTCPGCNQHTCSLTCVNKHKVDSGCDGQRNKAQFIRLNNFTDMDLLNDYRFLEDASRKADSAVRDKLKRQHHKPKHLNKMVNEARKRGVNLRLMPYPMSKRLHNKTYYQHQKKAFFWHVEWVFPLSQMKHSQRLPENTIVRSAVDDLLTSDLRYQLPGYSRTKVDQLLFLMKAEGQPTKQPKFYKLDPLKSLVENFGGKTIIEYPTVHIVYNTDQYSLIDSDGVEVKKSEEVMQRAPKPEKDRECTSDVTADSAQEPLVRCDDKFDAESNPNGDMDSKTEVENVSEYDVEKDTKHDEDSGSEHQVASTDVKREQDVESKIGLGTDLL